jgi:NitT/TauT family transport system substrate-binding protein
LFLWYYETVRGYLEGETYDEFMETTEQIEWLNRSVDRSVMHQLETQGILTDRILP